MILPATLAIAAVAAVGGGGYFYYSTIPPDFDSGVITSKHHEDGYYWTQMQCVVFATTGGCQTQIPVQHYQPPRWYFHLRRCDDKCHIGEHDVDQTTYDEAQVGDYFDHGTVRRA